MSHHHHHSHDHKHKQNHKHHHGHAHNHQHGGHSSGKILWFTVIITLAFAAIEAIAGWLANSLTLLSDAGHMLADSSTLVLAAIAVWISRKPPSRKHSYGLGRAEVISALGSSMLILLVVVGIAVEAVRRFQSPAPIAGGTVAIVAFLGFMVNLFVAYLLSRTEKTLNTRAALLHVLGDLLGSVAALVSGAIIYFTNWEPIDPILSIFICLLIVFSSYRLLKETFVVLMEGVPTHLNFEEVGMRMAKIAKVRSVHDLHIWTLSSGMTVLSAHIDIDQMSDWPNVLVNLQNLLKNDYHIEHITLQPEVIMHVMQKIVSNNKK